MALLLLDLDRFKEVNDSVGHGVGDRLLELIGPRVDSCLRGSDVLARLGGDEFAVVLTDQGDPESVAVIAERVVQALSRPFDLPEISLHIGVSIGIAICPDHAADVAALLRQADVAMYDAKSNGGGYRFYNRARDRHSRDRLETIEQLRAAIAGGELVLHYQPKIDLRTGAVPGVEALVRWEHPDRGVLTPDHFLPLVEHAGLMRQLTDTVLDAALAQLRSWRELGWDLSVAVNISTSCLLNARLGSQVATALERHEIPANKLSLEITENALMSDPVRAGQMISSLHERGIVVSVDDFGTGFSSLAYLRDFDVRELKLDQGFIKDVCSDSRSSAIVRSTVDLAHSLGLNIVAEGIEDEHSARLLTGFGCDVAQGFYYCRPIPAKDLGEWLLGRPGTASASEVRLDGTADQTAS